MYKVVDLAGLIVWLDHQDGASFSKWIALLDAMSGKGANYYGHHIRAEGPYYRIIECTL